MMIYLIDDKKTRQEFDYGWTEDKFSVFSKVLCPIYDYTSVRSLTERKTVFEEGNIILFHESFFDKTTNRHSKDSVAIRSDLNKFAAEKKGWVVFFSGSKSSRTLQDRVAHIPVSVLYKNLRDFVEKVNDNVIDLKYLLYGSTSPEIEEELLKKLEIANNRFDENEIVSGYKNFLVFSGNRIDVPVILQGAVERTFILEEKYNKEITDSYLHSKVLEWLTDDEVDNIFIPLCFGPSLSDYNGLQFACHIRCSDTINRLKPIFIYGCVDYSYLLDCEHFNILRTENVLLINYTREAFANSLLKQFEPLTITQLPVEIHTLKLDVPRNYEDAHSIANEWAIYRWALTIGASDEEIEKVTKNIECQLYFKYLQTLYPKSEIKLLNKDQLEIKFTGNPKILYIDDEADKGWYEILCRVFSDYNNISDVDYLCEELKDKSRDEIVKISMEKLKSVDNFFDLVILDFRLHPQDFNEHNIENVSGFRLLKEIKKVNPGIQVIVFSATNKIWNLKKLQEEGCDGFVLKEGIERNIVTSTYNSLKLFIIEVTNKLKRCFLKGLFIDLKTVKRQLNAIENLDENQKFKKFINELQKQLVVVYTSAQSINLDKPVTLDVVFLSTYNFIESFKKFYLNKKKDHHYYIGLKDEELKRYNVENNSVKDKGLFIPFEHYEKPGIFHVYSALLKDYFEVAPVFDADEYIRKFFGIKELRNEYIHGNKTVFKSWEIESIISLLLPLTFNITD